MRASSSIHPHDLGLPAPIIRKRRHARAVARWMLIIASLTALAGWPLYGRVFFFSIHHPDHVNPLSVLVAYSLLIASSITLILGLWYLLLAQVHRIARMVEADPLDLPPPSALCQNCGWPHDAPDRFCRHCGKSLASGPAGVTSISGSAVAPAAARAS